MKKMKVVKDEAGMAFEYGLYEEFTGYVNWPGVEGYVENATFMLHDRISFHPGMTLQEYGSSIIWYNGKWLNGVWDKGMWYDGIWEDGFWKIGTWKNGTWMGGVWENGTWYNGNWKGGVWNGGSWIYGVRQDHDE